MYREPNSAEEIYRHSPNSTVMMTTTHALFGALVGASTALFAPELTPTAVVVGFLGGAVPDVDLFAEHRRTTHFPIWGSVVALPIVVAAAVVGTPTAILVAVLAIAIAAHPVMDVLGGGIEHRPWEANSERAVYSHANGRWLRPKRVVRYAGSPEDLLVASVCAIPVLLVTVGALRQGMLGVLAFSGVFVAVRRRIPPLAEWLVGPDAHADALGEGADNGLSD